MQWLSQNTYFRSSAIYSGVYRNKNDVKDGLNSERRKLIFPLRKKDNFQRFKFQISIT